MIFILFLLGSIVVIAIAMVIYARWNYGVLESMGIPVFKPHFILGSETQIHRVIHHFEDQKRFHKYGPVWGMYEGRAPQVFICDPELIKQIFVKDFDHFHDRRIYETGHPLVDEMMDILPGDKWKIMRKFMTPNFTTSKIKMMSQEIQECVKDVIGHLDDLCKHQKSHNIKHMFTCLTVDVIARCFFGTKVLSIQDPDNEFIKNVTKLNGESSDMNIMSTILRVFPFIAKWIPNLYFQTPFSSDALTYFATVLGDIISSRKDIEVRNGDYVDLLNNVMKTIKSDDQYSKLGITEATVLSQAVLFLVAGFDTTAQTFTMLAYNLAMNPDKQKILTNEIDNMLERRNGLIDHESIKDLKYLSACINETLRMFSPLIRPERKCMKTWTNGPLKIEEGTTVIVPVWALHYNPEIFESPEDFLPERFLSEEKINAYTFMPFGLGPRGCIGMRFAQEEIKLTMCNILSKFRFASNSSTKVDFKAGRTFLMQMGQLHVDVHRRSV